MNQSNSNNQISFSWDLHYACNYRCPYCWWDGKWQELSKLNRYLSVKQWTKYWENIYSRYGRATIDILGGEPVIYPNFTELIKELSSMHTIIVSTNLSTDIEDFIMQIDPSKVKITPTFHPLFAEFDSFVKKVSIIKESGFTDEFGTVAYLAYPPQINQIDYYKEKFKQRGLSLTITTFWGKYNGVSYPEGYTQQEREIIAPNLGKRNREKFQLDTKEVKGKLCHAGHRYAVIQSDGNVLRCGGSGLGETIGNFFDENFKLLEKPMPCKAESCKCNEWAFLLMDEESGEAKLQKEGINDAGKEIINEPIKHSSFEKKNTKSNIFLINRELNKKEIIEKKTVLISKPIKLGIILTNRCNLNCIMCPESRKKGDTTLTEAAVQKTYQLWPYLERINWQGGEIFLIDYLKNIFWNMMPYSHITHEITTNGLLLDEEWIDLLLKLNVEFTFSIDSVVPETYEYIRKNAKFKDLIAKIKLLNKMEQQHNRRLEKGIVVVVMKSNFRELELFLDFAREYGFAGISFNPVLFIDSDENIFNDMDAKLKCFLTEEIENIERLAQEYNIFIFNRLPGISRKGPLNDKIKSPSPFCLLPWTSLWINGVSGGTIYPGCMCEYPIGDIYNTQILELWNNKTMLEYRNKLLSNELSMCNKNCVSGFVVPELLR